MKLAILGSKNSILGFKAIGLDVFNNFKEINLADYGILFITEDWAKKLQKEIDELSSQALPAIVVLPSVKDDSKEGLKNLKKIIEKAIGSDITSVSE